MVIVLQRDYTVFFGLHKGIVSRVLNGAKTSEIITKKWVKHKGHLSQLTTQGIARACENRLFRVLDFTHSPHVYTPASPPPPFQLT